GARAYDRESLQLLRASVANLTEEEFRQAYQIMAPLESEPVPSHVYFGIRKSLLDLLGSSRFAQVWSTRDTSLAAVSKVMAERGVSGEVAGEVFKLLGQAEERLVRDGQMLSSDPQRAAASGAAARQEQQRKLEDLVGPEIAAEIGQVQALESRKFFQRLTSLRN